MNNNNIQIRALTTLFEMKDVVELQKTIWGYGLPNSAFPYPDRCLFEFAESGGLVGGAFSDDKIIGFSAAWIGIDKKLNKQYLHSQLVGILEDYRDQKVGESLKLHQKEYAKSINLDLIKWTFDPLKTRNANLNLHKLKALVRTYTHNYYGNLQSSFNSGLDTDRFWVEWYIGSNHVNASTNISFDLNNLSDLLINQIDLTGSLPSIKDVNLSKNQSVLFVEVPDNFDHIQTTEIVVAKKWQTNLKEIFTHYFASEYVLTDFITNTENSKTRRFYKLEKQSLETMLNLPNGMKDHH